MADDDIVAKSADGIEHRFPSGTPDDVVDKAMKTYAEEHTNRTSTMEQFGSGQLDALYAPVQQASHGLDPARSDAPLWRRAAGQLVSGLPVVGPAAASQLIGGTIENPMDRFLQQREQGIETERGHDQSVDWARLAGNITSPLNLAGSGEALMAKGATAGANFARSVIGGIIGSLTQPVTDKGDYGTQKTTQEAVGTGAGGIGGLLGTGVSKGLEKVSDFASRNLPENVNIDAAKALLSRFKQDEKVGGLSAAAALDKVNASEKPVALADVGGKNVLAQAGRVARQPGESRAIAENFLTNRDNEAAVRLSGDIQKYISGGPSVFKATQDLLVQRSETAKPLYEATRSLQNIWSPRLQQFLDEPLVKSGMARGFEIERLVALAEGRPITATQLGVDLDMEGNIKLLNKPNMRLLDMAKQGLDAMIADERNQLTGRLSARGIALNQMRHAYVNEIDSLDRSGTYKAARAAWAGYSKSLDALRMGRTVLSGNAEENAATFNGLSDSEKEFYRMGVADQLKERMAKTGLHGDEAKSLIKNPWMRDMLRPAFRSNADFDKFVDAVTTETKMFETGRKVLGGSQTAERGVEDASPMDPYAIGWKAIVKAPTYLAHPLHFVADAWRMYQDMGIKPPEELNTKVAQILFSPRLDEADAVVKMLRSGNVPGKVRRFGRASQTASATPAIVAPQAAVGAVKTAEPAQNQ